MVYNKSMRLPENIILKNILTEEEIAKVYDVVNSTDLENTVVQNSMGHRAYLVSLGEDIREKLEKVVQDEFGSGWILNAYQFARYSQKYGYVNKLYPHFDDAFEDHKLTLDVQINATKPWPIVIEGKAFTLNNNEALIFSGTDQIHWREDVKFDDEDIIDMIFCHFTLVDDPRGKIDSEWIKSMQEKEDYWKPILNISDQPILTGSYQDGE